MLLYLLIDQAKKTISLPMIAPSEDVLKKSLEELNPENLEDLVIFPLCSLENHQELLTLRPTLNPTESIKLFDDLIDGTVEAMTVNETCYLNFGRTK